MEKYMSLVDTMEKIKEWPDAKLMTFLMKNGKQ
jgi:hypothetical protein